MSHDEIRQQKAMLLLEHQEAGELLAALTEKAKRQGDRIVRFGKFLSESPAKKIYRG